MNLLGIKTCERKSKAFVSHTFVAPFMRITGDQSQLFVCETAAKLTRKDQGACRNLDEVFIRPPSYLSNQIKRFRVMLNEVGSALAL